VHPERLYTPPVALDKFIAQMIVSPFIAVVLNVSAINISPNNNSPKKGYYYFYYI
jgi:hypothetical protein